MAKGMWLEHPDGQEQAVEQAQALRELAATMPEGPERDVIEDASAFLGAIADPDCPPRTTQELRDAAAWRAANPEDVGCRKRRMVAFNEAVLASRAAAEREAADAAE